ncbi:protein phosphatase 2C domain-containing protein [Paraliomyxa miuraensis]|uniref:protein phosphatase 2C domain-containing protein n=1 Tax=Paraliomyxa miuraensis TaxID=376150 RepID=UPI00225472E1|nr:protein phosphatase 2C domain-containing protein [Paraliomyxa miuraensis]MCX4242575.1 protein phosphatase 2C domain-containing protein [Paraliomyxa miuraensis]
MSRHDTVKVEQSVGESPLDPPGFIHLSAAVSDCGAREDNQDSFLVEDELGLYVVADGVGGHQAGDVASAMATEVLRDIISHWRRDPNGLKEKPWSVLHRAMEAACATIHRAATEKHALAGMSTTLTAVLIDGDQAVMGHVGDSRLYLLREGTLEQISSDHTLAAELYRGGVIAREHVDRHPHAHVLTRNVGTQPSVMVDTLLLEVRPGDLLLLCTDGLVPGLHPPERTVDLLDSCTDLAGALGKLVERAKAAGSRDNITAVVWRRDGDGSTLSRPMIDALRSVPLFARLSLADLALVAAEMSPRSYDAGQTVVHQGERNGALYVVLEGRLRWQLADGHFAHLERGSGIGSTTLVAARRCPATLGAELPTRVLVMGCEAFRSLCKLRPRLGTQLLTALADELSDWIDPETDRGVARPPHGLLVEY